MKGRRTRKQLVGPTKTADQVSRERELRRLRRELTQTRKAIARVVQEGDGTAEDQDWPSDSPTAGQI